MSWFGFLPGFDSAWWGVVKTEPKDHLQPGVGAVEPAHRRKPLPHRPVREVRMKGSCCGVATATAKIRREWSKEISLIEMAAIWTWIRAHRS